MSRDTMIQSVLDLPEEMQPAAWQEFYQEEENVWQALLQTPDFEAYRQADDGTGSISAYELTSPQTRTLLVRYSDIRFALETLAYRLYTDGNVAGIENSLIKIIDTAFKHDLAQGVTQHWHNILHLSGFGGARVEKIEGKHVYEFNVSAGSIKPVFPAPAMEMLFEKGFLEQEGDVFHLTLKGKAALKRLNETQGEPNAAVLYPGPVNGERGPG